MNPYYFDESVTLYHGDCREVTAWLEADVLVTDPPYGIQHSMHGDNAPAIAGESRTGRSALRVLTDEHVDVRDAAIRSWGERPALMFGHWRAPRPARTMMRLIWDKQTIGMGGVGAWRPADEEIYLLAWPNPRGGSSDQPSVIRHPANRGSAREDHPTPKPVGLMEYLIRHCPPGIVADPFAGSGSTLVAAKQLGRKAIGVELEESYCEIIAKRLAQGVLDFGSAS
jgi:site-specific DNA-methyltransferase (adenine-specific)